jgi:hypothetical protein
MKTILINFLKQRWDFIVIAILLVVLYVVITRNHEDRIKANETRLDIQDKVLAKDSVKINSLLKISLTKQQQDSIMDYNVIKNNR